jgi:hypothetical protein
MSTFVSRFILNVAVTPKSATEREARRLCRQSLRWHEATSVRGTVYFIEVVRRHRGPLVAEPAKPANANGFHYDGPSWHSVTVTNTHVAEPEQSAATNDFRCDISKCRRTGPSAVKNMSPNRGRTAARRRVSVRSVDAGQRRRRVPPRAPSMSCRRLSRTYRQSKPTQIGRSRAPTLDLHR